MVFTSCKMEKQFKEMLEKRRKELDEMRFNEEEFKEKDVVWISGSYGVWINLALNTF